MIQAYLAGLFDGEGTVTLSTLGQPVGTRRPYVSLTSTTYEFMLILRNNYGGCIRHHSTKNDKHKASWIWSLANNKALKFLSDIRPYLLDPEKCRRIDMLITRYKSVTPRNGWYTKEGKALKLEFDKEFFKNSTKVKFD